MTSKEKVRAEIDAAIARIDAKLAVGSDQDEELQHERRDLEAARNMQANAESDRRANIPQKSGAERRGP